MEIVYTPLIKIIEPKDPARLNIDQEKMQQLIDSINDPNIGLLHPILLKRDGEYFEIEAGHRRFMALRHLHWDKAPSIILGDTDSTDMHLARAHENLIKADISVIEEAKLVNSLVNEHGRGIDETARLIKRSEHWIEQRLDLLDYPPDLIAALTNVAITLTVAKALSKCTNTEYRLKLLEYVIDTGANAKTVSRWVSDSSVEEFTEALDRSKQSGDIQQLDLGPAFMECGICTDKHKVEKLRHIFLCPECLEGVLKIRHSYVHPITVETGDAINDEGSPATP